LQAIPRLRLPVCRLCGGEINSGELCPGCSTRPLSLHGIRSATAFGGTVRAAIHGLKYNRRSDLARPLSALLVEAFHRFELPVDVVVPVPLHTSRLRQRGYNQAALLAREFAGQLSLPLNEQAMIRQRQTASQTALNAMERRANVADAFLCLDQGLAGKRVLLVDDVCTTGATLEACAAALFHHGAATVWGLTVARTVMPSARGEPAGLCLAGQAGFGGVR